MINVLLIGVFLVINVNSSVNDASVSLNKMLCP